MGFIFLINISILYWVKFTFSEAVADIDRALTLTEGKRTRARAQALCQRGSLLRKRGSDDEARAAFAEAAKLGSGFAKKQVMTSYFVRVTTVDRYLPNLPIDTYTRYYTYLRSTYKLKSSRYVRYSQQTR